jgi:4-carboxymuconolactone decarboxylase
MHPRAALTNGVTIDELNEVLLQTAVYCGVPGGQHGVPHRQRGAGVVIYA